MWCKSAPVCMLHYWYMWSRTHVCKICFARIGSIRSGVPVGANGDPMAGTPDSDTTGRAEPPDGCTCETAAMARCIRSLCLEYQRRLKALLMASLCLVLVGWVMWILHILIWNTSRMKKIQRAQSTQQNPLNPYKNTMRVGSHLEPVRHFQEHWVDSMPAWYDFVHSWIDTLPGIEWRSYELFTCWDHDGWLDPCATSKAEAWQDLKRSMPFEMDHLRGM